MMAAAEFFTPKIDPENLFNFSFTYNCDPLKNAIGYILDQLRDNTSNIAFLKEKAGIPVTQVIPSTVSSNTLLELKSRISFLEEKVSHLEAKEANKAYGKASPRLTPRKVEKVETKTVPVPESKPEVIKEEKKETREEIKYERSSSMLFALQQETEQRITDLEIEVKKLKMRANKIPETGDFGAEKPNTPSEATPVPVDNWKDKMDLIKLEIKSAFAEKKDLQKTNYELDKLANKLEHVTKAVKDFDDSACDQSIKELREEVSAIRAYMENKALEQVKDEPVVEINESKEENAGMTPRVLPSDEDRKVAPKNIEPKAAPLPSARKIVVSNMQDQQMIRSLGKRVKELEEKMVDVRAYADNNGMGVREIKEKMADLAQSLEKKAAVLDLKKMSGFIDDINERNASLIKEVDSLKASIKVLEGNEEIKSLKLKVSSLDNKLTIGLKNLKELQAKVAENMGLQIIPQSQTAAEDDEKADERFAKFSEEINEKINLVKQTVQSVKKEFQKLSEALYSKMDDKVSSDSLVELENKMYKELDKVLLTLTKKISGDDYKKGFKLLQSQVKRLYDFYTTSAQLLKDTTEEASVIKRSLGGISCASCDKDVTNLYTALNQSQDYAAWNKLPQREAGAVLPKGAGFAKIVKGERPIQSLRAIPPLEIGSDSTHLRVGSIVRLEDSVSPKQDQKLPEIILDKKKP